MSASINTKPPLVSAICCTHGRPLFLRKTIDLFMAQTWPNKEMVIMNDGRVGDVPNIAGLPIRHVWTSGYEGMTRKQRWAFEIAQGELLCYFDDDDYHAPQHIEDLARPILAGAADATGFHMDLIVSTPRPRFWRWKQATLEEWATSAKVEKPVGSSVPFHDGTAMFRRSLLEGMPESIRDGWQLGLLEEMRKRGARLLALRNTGQFAYVRHGGNAWRFALEDKCSEVSRPDWMPDAMVDFWSSEEPARQARDSFEARAKDHNGV